MLFSESWFSVIFFVEMSTFMFFLSLLEYKKFFFKLIFDIFLKYFLIQSFNLLLFIFFMLNYEKAQEVFLYFWILCKLSLPPFHLWFFLSMKFIKKEMLVMFLTIQKLPFFMMAHNILFSKMVELIMFTGLASMGAIFLLLQKESNMINFLIFSSMVHSWWMIFIVLNQTVFFWLYFMLYSLYIYMFLENFNFLKMMNPKYLIVGFYFFVMMGFPPFILFFLKLKLIMLFMNISFIFTSLMMLCLFLSYFFYFKMIFLLFLK